MQRGLTTFFAYELAIVGIIGLFVGETQLWNFTNIDLAMDLVRLALAAVLFAALYRWAEISIRSALTAFGTVFLAMGILAALSSSIFGLMPHHLSSIDVAWHWIAGIVALVVAASPAAIDEQPTVRGMAQGFGERIDRR